MLRQVYEKLVFDRREMHLIRTNRNLPTHQVDFQVAKLHHLSSIGRRCTLHVPQCNSHSSEKFIDPERFREIIVRTGIERHHLVVFAAPCRNDDNWHTAPFTNASSYL